MQRNQSKINIVIIEACYSLKKNYSKYCNIFQYTKTPRNAIILYIVYAVYHQLIKTWFIILISILMNHNESSIFLELKLKVESKKRKYRKVEVIIIATLTVHNVVNIYIYSLPFYTRFHDRWRWILHNVRVYLSKSIAQHPIQPFDL